MAEGDTVNKQVTDATTQTNVKSWHDGHMGVALGMAESHAAVVASMNKSHAAVMSGLDQTYATAIGSLNKRIVEPDVAQAVAERLIGGAGQSAVQGDQAASLANILTQFGSVVAALEQIAKMAGTTPPITVKGVKE